LRYFGRTQFASRDCLSLETVWTYLSSMRVYRKLTTFYKMNIKLVCFANSILYFSENINVFERTAAIYNGKIVDTGAKDLPLIHVYMDSN
jgi:hypothetical protein